MNGGIQQLPYFKRNEQWLRHLINQCKIVKFLYLIGSLIPCSLAPRPQPADHPIIFIMLSATLGFSKGFRLTPLIFLSSATPKVASKFSSISWAEALVGFMMIIWCWKRSRIDKALIDASWMDFILSAFKTVAIIRLLIRIIHFLKRKSKWLLYQKLQK